MAQEVGGETVGGPVGGQIRLDVEELCRAASIRPVRVRDLRRATRPGPASAVSPAPQLNETFTTAERLKMERANALARIPRA
ncbi:hypothetical protein SGFS_032420 [Streptomyces graminofaciens]|jgi:hypothetical protein|uniref:Uncharacterized protein n=1 Tax=Streptomyces graminofaciens TaxID=68212 RepID=A0ABM7F5W3_9ACTN|nr:hypothetical protein [Streptomyces graminofaciens]BBC31948.1 hypothetical protein SGFS_032420 [Streptomyces graminofaciens]